MGFSSCPSAVPSGVRPLPVGPPEGVVDLRPGAASSQARSVHVVPPDFDGLLRTSPRRSVAPCRRPWGSPRFRHVRVWVSGARPSARGAMSPSSSRSRPRFPARRWLPRQVALRRAPGPLRQCGIGVSPRSCAPTSAGPAFPASDRRPRRRGFRPGPAASPRWAGGTSPASLPATRGGGAGSPPGAVAFPCGASPSGAFPSPAAAPRHRGTCPLAVRSGSGFPPGASPRHRGAFARVRPQGFPPPTSPLRREALPPRPARCSHGLA